MPTASRTPSLRAALGFVVLIAAVALALGGCGDGSAGAATSGAPAAGTRTVENVDGTSTKVPAHPERVVTLSEPTLDATLALGVQPVGSIAGRGQKGVPGYLQSKAGDVPIVGSVAQLDYEKIAKVKPDLILVDGTSGVDPSSLKTLRKIAPTVNTGEAGGDWHDNLALVAKALGKVKAGKKVVADYDAKVASARKKLARYSDDTFSVVRWQGGSFSMILEELPAGMALDDLGLERPASQDRRGPGHSVPVSSENLPEIDADYIFFATLGGASQGNPDVEGDSGVAGAEKALTDAAKVPGWKNLDAVRAGNVEPVDGSVWASTGGPILMTHLIDSVVETLA